MMKVTLINGRPAVFLNSGEPTVTDITCGIRYKGSDGDIKEEYIEDSWSLEETSDGFAASCDGTTLTFAPEGKGFTVRCSYVRRGESLPRCDDFVTFRGKLHDKVKKLVAAEIREVNGNRSNEMLTGVCTFDFSKGPETCHECGDFGSLITEGGQGYIAGYLTSNKYFSGVWIDRDGNIEARCFTERHPLPKGKTLVGDVFYLTPADDPVREICDYCDTQGRYSEFAPRHKFDVPSGFCTWYYYLNEINSGIIERSSDEMAAHRETLPVRYVQIDDGWQVCYGQWSENERFTVGMKALADKIKSDGFLPGLWFAPLWARIAQVAKDHPEYFAKDRDTREQTLCFDYSVPGTREYMREVFHRATYDWGYKYLKLDLMTTCLGDYVYSDPDFNSLRNYKECMRLIVETVPEDTFLLGCTAPFMPYIGLVDGVRSSCDIFGDWASLKETMLRTLKRFYYHKRLFINDADCLIIRKSENEDDECQRQCTRNDEEIKTYISATAASGGILMFSDKLSLLSDEQKKLLSYLFPQNKDAAIPLDLFERSIPAVLDCGIKNKIRTVVLANWYDEELTLTVDADGCHVFEFWSGEYRGICGADYTVTLKPHCCEVLFLTKAGAPVVIGTDSALIPDIDQCFCDGCLTFSFEKKGETLYVAAESVSGDTAEIKKLSDGLFAVKAGEGSLKTALKAE